MTKKDYIPIAADIRRTWGNTLHSVGTRIPEGEPRDAMTEMVNAIFYELIRDLSSTFKRDNSNFDTGRFKDACNPRIGG